MRDETNYVLFHPSSLIPHPCFSSLLFIRINSRNKRFRFACAHLQNGVGGVQTKRNHRQKATLIYGCLYCRAFIVCSYSKTTTVNLQKKIGRDIFISLPIELKAINSFFSNLPSDGSYIGSDYILSG